MYLSTAHLAVCILLAGVPRTYLSELPELPYMAESAGFMSSCTAAQDTLDVAVVASEMSGRMSSSAPVRTMHASGIVNSGAKTLDEVVKTFAGISVRDYGGAGGLKTVSVRNLGSQHTTVSYDGITISDAQNGQVDIGRFNLDNIGQVSVSIGCTDDIFRSARHFTSSGILEIKSKKPDFVEGPAQVTARMGISSFGTYSPYFFYRQLLCQGWSVSASAGYLASKGDYPFVLHNGKVVTYEKRLNSDVSALNTEFSISGDMGKGGEFSAKVFYTGSERGLPGSVILYTQNPSERLWDRNIVSAVSYTVILGAAWKAHAGLGYSRAYNRYVDTDASYQVPEDDRYVQQEYSVSAILQYQPVECVRIVFAEDFFVNSLCSDIPECQFPVRYSSMTAMSAQYSSGRITATAGLAGTYSHETVRRLAPAPDRKRFSPFVSMSCKVLEGEDLRLRFSLKDGFRVPTFNDLYYARVGNTLLLPEKALQTNLGVTWLHSLKGGSLSVTADCYYNKVKDKIVATPTMFIWKMRNVGKVMMAGTDIAASFHHAPADWLAIDVSAGYSFQYAVDVTDPEAKSYMHQIPYTPRHTGNIGVRLETPWVNISYMMTSAGERFSLAQNIPMNRIAPYFDHGLSVNRTFRAGPGHRYEIFAGAEALNIGNCNYEIIRYYPMPGRSFRLTLKFAL